jgi:hypothetical protein
MRIRFMFSFFLATLMLFTSNAAFAREIQQEDALNERQNHMINLLKEELESIKNLSIEEQKEVYQNKISKELRKIKRIAKKILRDKKLKREMATQLSVHGISEEQLEMELNKTQSSTFVEVMKNHAMDELSKYESYDNLLVSKILRILAYPPVWLTVGSVGLILVGLFVVSGPVSIPFFIVGGLFGLLDITFFVFMGYEPW